MKDSIVHPPSGSLLFATFANNLEGETKCLQPQVGFVRVKGKVR
jgi:hypothetical protein